MITPSSGTTANPINGKEQTNVDNTDLQYACTFQLPMTRDCTTPECDCGPGTEPRNRSLCSASGAGTPGNTQYFAKAYPGLRHLQVLKDFGPNAIVASICPKKPTSNDPRNDPDYGYNPAVAAIVDRLKEALKGRCLPRELVVEEDGTVPCAVIEAMPTSACSCDASRSRQPPATAEIQEAVLKHLASTGICDAGPGSQSCSTFCLCEILQTQGADLQTCQNTAGVLTSPIGYCYVEDAQPYADPMNPVAGPEDIGNPAIVAPCPGSSKRLLRFVGDNTPAKGSVAVIACLGASLGTDEAAPMQ
jgi:hypothetical protein